MAQVVNQVLWALVWFFISWPISGFCSFIYIFFNAFRACCPCLKGLNDVLQKGVECTGTASDGVCQGGELGC
ncbi:hypothetical protein DIPPA_09179 [Diplonema papillatum]|nr:hypothetical protein DIPPA_09179 [Diplonema papillatum]|eukprot:gene3115-4891_t